MRRALILGVTAIAMIASVATSDRVDQCATSEDCLQLCESQLPAAQVEPQRHSMVGIACDVAETVIVDDEDNTSHIVSARPMCRCGGSFTITLWGDDEFCFREGRDLQCLFDAREVEACTPGDPSSCDATCDEFAARLSDDQERVIESSVARARCEDVVCSCVYEVEGRCFTPPGNARFAFAEGDDEVPCPQIPAI